MWSKKDSQEGLARGGSDVGTTILQSLAIVLLSKKDVQLRVIHHSGRCQRSQWNVIMSRIASHNTIHWRKWINRVCEVVVCAQEETDEMHMIMFFTSSKKGLQRQTGVVKGVCEYYQLFE